MRLFDFFHFKKYARYTAVLCVVAMAAMCVFAGFGGSGALPSDDATAYLPEGETQYSSGGNADSLNTVTTSGDGKGKKYIDGLNDSNVNAYIDRQYNNDKVQNPTMTSTLDYSSSWGAGQQTLAIDALGTNTTIRKASKKYDQKQSYFWGLRVSDKDGSISGDASGDNWYAVQTGYGGLFWTSIEFTEDMMAAFQSGRVSNMGFRIRFDTGYKGWPNANARDLFLYGSFWTKTPFVTESKGVTTSEDEFKIENNGGTFSQPFHDFINANQGFVDGKTSASPDGASLDANAVQANFGINKPTDPARRYLTVCIRTVAKDAMYAGIQTPDDGPIRLYWTNNSSPDTTAPTISAQYLSNDVATTTTAAWSKSKALKFTISDGEVGVSRDSYITLKDNAVSGGSTTIKISELAAKFGQSNVSIVATGNSYGSSSKIEVTIKNPAPTGFSSNPRIEVQSVTALDGVGNSRTFNFSCTSSRSGESGFVFERYDPDAPIAPTVSVADAVPGVVPSIQYVVNASGSVTFNFSGSRATCAVGGETNEDKWLMRVLDKGQDGGEFWLNNAYVMTGSSKTLNINRGGVFDVFFAAYDGVEKVFPTGADDKGKIITLHLEKHALDATTVSSANFSVPTLQNGATWSVGGDAGKYVFDAQLNYTPFSEFAIYADITEYRPDGSTAQVKQSWKNTSDAGFGTTTTGSYTQGGAGRLTREFKNDIYISVTRIYIDVADLGIEIELYSNQTDVKIDTATAENVFNVHGQDAFEFNKWYNGSITQGNIALSGASFYAAAWDGATFQYAVSEFANDLAIDYLNGTLPSGAWTNINTNDPAAATLALNFSGKHVARYKFKITLPNGTTAELSEYTTDSGSTAKYNVLYDPTVAQFSVGSVTIAENGQTYDPSSGAWTSKQVKVVLDVTNFDQIGNASALKLMVFYVPVNADSEAFSPNKWIEPLHTTNAMNRYEGRQTAKMTLYVDSANGTLKFRADTDVNTGAETSPQTVKVDTVKPAFTMSVFEDGSAAGVYHDVWTNAASIRVRLDNILAGESGYSVKYAYRGSYETIEDTALPALWNSADYASADMAEYFYVNGEGVQYLHMILMNGTGEKFVQGVFRLQGDAENVFSGHGIYTVKVDRTPVTFDAQLPVGKVNYFTGDTGYAASYNVNVTSTEGDATSPIKYYIGFGADGNYSGITDSEWIEMTFDVTAGTLSATLSNLSTDGFKTMFVKAVDEAGNVSYSTTTGPLTVLGKEKYTLDLGTSGDARFTPSITINRNGEDTVVTGKNGADTLEIFEGDLVSVSFGLSNVNYYKLISMATGFDQSQLTSGKNGVAQIEFALSNSAFNFRALKLGSGAYTLETVIKTIVNFRNFKWTYQKGNDTFKDVTYEMYYENDKPLSSDSTGVSVKYRTAGTTDAFSETKPTAFGRYDFVVEIADSDATYVGSYVGVVIWTDADEMSVVFDEQSFVYCYDDYAEIFADPVLANKFLTVKTLSSDADGVVTESQVTIDNSNIATIFGSLTINGTAFASADMITAGDYTLVMNVSSIAIGGNNYKLVQTTIVTVKPMELRVVTGEEAGTAQGNTLSKVYDGTTDPVYRDPAKPLFPYLLFKTNTKRLNGDDIVVVEGIVASSDLTYRSANVHTGTAILHNVAFKTANYVLENGATSADIPAEIKQRPLTLTLSQTYSRQFDTTTGINGFEIGVNVSFSNAVSGEESKIKLGYARGYFNDKDVADASFITLENLQVQNAENGAVNGNYTIAEATEGSLRVSQDAASRVITATIDATITKKIITDVTWSGTNLRKTFDGKGATNLGVTFAGLTEIADTNGNGIPDVMEPLFKVFDRAHSDAPLSGFDAIGDQGRYTMRFVHSGADAAINEAVANYKVELPADADDTRKAFVYIIDPLEVDIDFSDSSMQYDAAIPQAVYGLTNAASATEAIILTKESGVDFNFTAKSGGTTVFRIPDGYSLKIEISGQGLAVGKSTISAKAGITVPSGKESAGNIVARINTTGASFEILKRNIKLGVSTSEVSYSGGNQSNIDISDVVVTVTDDNNSVLYQSSDGKPNNNPLKENIYAALYSRSEKFLLSIRDGSGNLAKNAGSYFWADEAGLNPDAGKTKGSFSVFVGKSAVNIKPIKYVLDFDLNSSYVYGSYSLRDGNPFTGDTLSYSVLDETGNNTDYVGDDGVQIIDYVLATLEKTSGDAGYYGNVGEYRIKVENNLSELSETAKKNFVFLNVYAQDGGDTGYVATNYTEIGNSGYSPAYRTTTITPMTIRARLDAESYVYGGIAYSGEYSAYADLSTFTTAQLNADGFKLKFTRSDGNKTALLEDGDFNKFVSGSSIKLMKDSAAIAADNAKGVLDSGDYVLKLDSASLGANYVITDAASISAAVTVNKFALNVRSGEYTGKTYDGAPAYNESNKPEPVATHFGAVADLNSALHSGVFGISYAAYSGATRLSGLDQMINAGTYTVKTTAGCASGQEELYKNYDITVSDVGYVIAKRPITVDFVYATATGVKVGGEHAYNSAFEGISNFDASNAANYKISFSGFAAFASSQSGQTVSVARGSAVVRNGVTVGYQYVLSYVELSAEIAGNTNFEFSYGNSASTSRYITMLKVGAALSVEISQYYGDNYTDATADGRVEKVDGSVNAALLEDIKAKGALNLTAGYIPVALGEGYTDTRTLNAGTYNDSVLVFSNSYLRENPYYNITAVNVVLNVEAVGVRIEAEADMVYGGVPTLKGSVKYVNERNGAVIAADFGATPVFDGISAQITEIGSKEFTGANLFTGFVPTGDYKLSAQNDGFKLTVNVTPKPVTVSVTGGTSKAYDGIASAAGADGKVELTGVGYDTAAFGAQLVGSDALGLTFKRDAGDDAGEYAMYVEGNNRNYSVAFAADSRYSISQATVTVGFKNGDATLGVKYFTEIGTPTGGILKAALDKLDFSSANPLEAQIRTNSAIYMNGSVLDSQIKLTAGEHTLSIALGDNKNLASGIVAEFVLTVTPYELDSSVAATLGWKPGMSSTVGFGTRVSEIVNRLIVGISGLDYNLTQAIIGALGFTFTENTAGSTPIKSEDGQRLLDAGSYTVGLYCKDTDNFTFAQSSIAAKLSNLVVEKLALEVSFDDKDSNGIINKIFNGKEQNVAYTLRTQAGIVDDIHPVIKYKPEGTADTEYVDGYPKNAGKYTVKIDLSADNYVVAGSVTCDMTIAKKALGADTHTVRIDTLSSIFDGGEFGKDDISVSFIDKSTNIADTVNFSVKFGYYKEDGSFVESDKVRSAGGYVVRVTVDDVNYEYTEAFAQNANSGERFVVNKNSNISGDIKSELIVFNNDSETFDPNAVVTVSTNAASVFDEKFGFVYSLTVEGQDDLALREAGTYAVVLTVTSPNYSNVFTLRHTYKVNPKPIDVSIEIPQNAVYTGNAHTVSASASDDSGNPLNVYLTYKKEVVTNEYVSVKGALDAGKYIVTAEIENRNYTANSANGVNTREFTVAPAPADFEFVFDDTNSQLVEGKREFLFPSGRNASTVNYKISLNGVAITPELTIKYFDANGQEVKLEDENGKPLAGVRDIGRYTVTVVSNDSNYSINAETVLSVRKARFTDYEIVFENISEKYDGDYFDSFIEIDWKDENLRKAIDVWQEDNATAQKDIIYFDNYVYYRIDEIKAFENNITPDQYDALTIYNAPEGVLVPLPNNGSTDGAPYDPALGFNDEMARNVGIYRIQCVMEARGEVNIGTAENPIPYTLDFDSESIWCTLTIKTVELVLDVIRSVDEVGNGVIEVGTSPIAGAEYRLNGSGEWQSDNKFVIAKKEYDAYADYFAEVRLSDQAAVNYGTTYKMVIVVKEKQPISTELILAVVGVLIGVIGLIVGIVLLRKKFYSKSRKERKADKKAAKKAKKLAKKQKKTDKRNARRGIIPADVMIAEEDSEDVGDEASAVVTEAVETEIKTDEPSKTRVKSKKRGKKAEEIVSEETVETEVADSADVEKAEIADEAEEAPKKTRKRSKIDD